MKLLRYLIRVNREGGQLGRDLGYGTQKFGGRGATQVALPLAGGMEPDKAVGATEQGLLEQKAKTREKPQNKATAQDAGVL